MKRILLAATLLASGALDAGIYKCKDAQGGVKIQDKPCGADAAMPVPRMLPPPPAEAGAEPETPAAAPEVLYRIDPATGHLVPVTAAPPAPKPQPKGNWDRYADRLEQENQARDAAKQRSAEDNQAAAEEFRRRNQEYEKRQQEEAGQRAEQQRLNDAEDEQFRTDGR